MPNHITNILTFSGSKENVKRLRDFIKGDEGEQIDFNKIIPMPEELDVEESTLGEMAMLYVQKRNSPNPPADFINAKARIEGMTDEKREEAIKLGKTLIHNKIMYGHTTWYPWRIANWGTKWNAYDSFEENDKEIWFNTAWNAPRSVVYRLSELFPEVTIMHTYADEDAGYNCGKYVLRNGMISHDCTPVGGSDDAMAIYFETHPGEEDFYVMNEAGEWVWRED